MPISNVPVGGVARAIHVQQILNWLRGNPTYSEPVSFTGISSGVTYALTVLNLEASGRALMVKDSSSNVEIFGVRNSGVTIKPVTAGVSAFRVRNLADTDNVFEVTDTGVSIGGISPVTLTGTQTLTNKTLTSPIVSGIRTTDFMDVTRQSTAPDAPSAAGNGNIRLYGMNTDEFLRYKGATGAIEKTLVDTDSTQTLSNKTLTAPVIGTYVDVLQPSPSAPANPAAARLRLYSLSGGGSDDFFKYRDTNGNEFTLVNVESAQTLINKTLTTPTLTGPYASDFFGLGQAGLPDAPSANRLRLYGIAGEDLIRYRASDGDTFVIANLESAQTLINKTLTAPTISSPYASDFIELGQAGLPASPTANRLRLYGIGGEDVFRYRASDGDAFEVVNTVSPQTLTNKTLGSGTIFSSASFSGLTTTNYLDMQKGSTPGNPDANYIRFFAKTDNNIYFRTESSPAGVAGDILIHTDSNSPASTGLARSLALGGL
jgi:hypothetical protein